MREKTSWPIVAICYDFDKTLSPKDMQNFGLIPKLGCKVSAFWKASNKIAQEQGMDKILAYMKLIVDKAQSREAKIAREDFNALGKTIELFPGVDSWFERINKIAESLEINVEHYIISAGLKEIIEGTTIAKFFTGIYASEFYYDQYGKPMWPCQVVNYTTKTQYLFRINKNCLDMSDEDSVNQYIPNEERRIPLSNFIYIGDSETDIPAMKIVKQGGGTSIGVYNPINCDLDRVLQLLKQDRIDYLMPADYREKSKIEKAVCSVLNEIHTKFKLKHLHSQQRAFVNDLEEVDEFAEYTEQFISDGDLTLEDINSIEKKSKKIIRKIKKNIIDAHVEVGGAVEIDMFVTKKQEYLKKKFDDKRKKISKKNSKQQGIQ